VGAVALAAVGFAPVARAQELQLPPPPEAPGIAREPAPDLLAGRFTASADAGFVVPLGSIASGVGLNQLASTSLSFGGALGVGLGRAAELRALGHYVPLASSGTCASCGGHTYDLGLGLVYHVSQALAMDPWVSYGVAYRSLHISDDAADARSTDRHALPGDATSISYKGLDFARLSLGADFRPLRALGVGAYMETDLGSFFSRPGADTAASVYLFFGVGARITLGPLPSGPAAGATPATRSASR
jgi:hypothetical protein